MITMQTTWDALLRQSMQRFLPQWDWRWLKAQLFQESQLNVRAKNARSGAIGIAQFMPSTWGDMLANVPGIAPHATPADPLAAIPAAAWYMAKLRRMWRTDRPEDDRRQLAQASYNAGFGNLVRAQQYAGGARDYASIIARLPDVTGQANAAETRGYVEHIQRWYDQLAAADTTPEVHA